MAEVGVQPKKPVLLVAAESIAASSGVAQTVADVLRGRALSHYGEALRQYLAIRLGDARAAQRAMLEVERRLSEWPHDELTAEPGARARLFRLARRVAEENAEAAPSASVRRVEFHAPSATVNASYAKALEAVRSELSPLHRELLELRYARELATDELAFVMRKPLEWVITELQDAAEHARGFLGSSPPSQLGGMRGALQEAFALVPATADGTVSGKPKRRGLPKGTIVGERYSIESRIGEGSFGDVYRALDTDVPGHVVALKLLHRQADNDAARKSALRELRLIASVFHPSVVNFKDHGWHEERLWFVMPWYEGETLEERIRRAPLTRAEAADIFGPLAQALATMHEAGIRHQDIKPDNIFLARIGDGGFETRILPVLIDLGVAAKEAEMIVAGTPLYFAPEIAAQYASKPARAITFKADVFSLALALRNALEPDTQEEVPGTAVEAFIGYRAEHPPGPPEARELAFLTPHFERWLSLDPERRPSAEELAAELRVLTSPERRRDKRRALIGWMAPLAVGSAVAIGSVTYVYLQEREESQRARTLAENTREDLNEESARRLELEVASAALQQDYAESLLSRDELAEQLGDRTQRNRRLERALIQSRRETRDAQGQLEDTLGKLQEASAELSRQRRRVDGMRDELEQTKAELATTSERHVFAKARLAETEQRLTRAESDLNVARSRARDLIGELASARSSAHDEQERASKLEGALLGAQQDRSDAQRELVQLKRELAEATGRLRKAQSANQSSVPSVSSAGDPAAAGE